MARKKAREKKQRASIGFSPGQYEELLRMAEEKKVSVGWVVRDAVEKYLEGRGDEHDSTSSPDTSG